MSEPEGRGAAWTEERATQERATREGGASEGGRGGGWGPAGEPEARSAASRRRGAGADVRAEPGGERLAGGQEPGHVLPGRRRAEPGLERPLLPGHHALVPQEPDPGVVGRITPGRALQHVLPVHGDLLPLDGRDDPLEFLAEHDACHGLTVTVKLVGGHAVHPAAGGEAIRRQLDVAVADERPDVRLVERLV